jgi:DNA topoisomerase-2
MRKIQAGHPLRDNLYPLVPYFEGFKGTYTEDGVVGVYRKEKDEFVVTELPPGTWTAEYREWLEKELAEGRIKDFSDTSTDQQINIRIKGIDEKALVKSLTEKVRTTNMHAFNSKGVITKYETLTDILCEFWTVRINLYETRREYQIKTLNEKLPYHVNVGRFIRDQIQDEPEVNLKKKTLEECNNILGEHEYQHIDGSYEYIMRLPVSAFTAEKVAKHERDMADLKAEIHRLECTNAERLWLADLEQV